MNNKHIRVLWNCKQDPYINGTGKHEEKLEAARCVFQDNPRALRKWMDENYVIPTRMEFKK